MDQTYSQRRVNLFNGCIIYSALLFLYYYQDALKLTGSIITKLAGVFVILWSFYHMWKVNTSNRLPTFFRALNVFIIVLSIYAVLYMVVPSFGGGLQGVPRFNYIKLIYLSLLPSYSYYYFSKKGYMTYNFIKFFVLIILVASIGVFYINQIRFMEVIQRDEITNNMGYTFAAILPILVIFRKKPLFQMALVLICFVFILRGMKRGAILVSAIMLVYFVIQLLKNTKGRGRLYAIILITLGIGFAIYSIRDMVSNSSYFVGRWEDTLEGNASGRENYYPNLIRAFTNDSNTIEQLLGHGPYYSVTVNGNYAHQDWLELLVDLGLLGVVLYVYYFVGLWKDARRRKRDGDIYAMMLMTFLFLFIVSLFSMSYDSGYIPISMSLGYTLSYTPGPNASK